MASWHRSVCMQERMLACVSYICACSWISHLNLFCFCLLFFLFLSCVIYVVCSVLFSCVFIVLFYLMWFMLFCFILSWLIFLLVLLCQVQQLLHGNWCKVHPGVQGMKSTPGNPRSLWVVPSSPTVINNATFWPFESCYTSHLGLFGWLKYWQYIQNSLQYFPDNFPFQSNCR